MESRHYKICEVSLNILLDEIRNEIKEGNHTEEDKKKWRNEVEYILSGEGMHGKFARLMNADVFTFIYGDMAYIKDDTFIVVCLYHRVRKPHSYSPFYIF